MINPYDIEKIITPFQQNGHRFWLSLYIGGPLPEAKDLNNPLFDEVVNALTFGEEAWMGVAYSARALPTYEDYAEYIMESGEQFLTGDLPERMKRLKEHYEWMADRTRQERWDDMLTILGVIDAAYLHWTVEGEQVVPYFEDLLSITDEYFELTENGGD